MTGASRRVVETLVMVWTLRNNLKCSRRCAALGVERGDMFALVARHEVPGSLFSMLFVIVNQLEYAFMDVCPTIANITYTTCAQRE